MRQAYWRPKMERESHRPIGAPSAEMQTLHRIVVVKQKLILKVKLLVYKLIYVPTLTCGHELWVITERLRIQATAQVG